MEHFSSCVRSWSHPMLTFLNVTGRAVRGGVKHFASHLPHKHSQHSAVYLHNGNDSNRWEECILFYYYYYYFLMLFQWNWEIMLLSPKGAWKRKCENSFPVPTHSRGKCLVPSLAWPNQKQVGPALYNLAGRIQQLTLKRFEGARAKRIGKTL